jgi:hypothetical protein
VFDGDRLVAEICEFKRVYCFTEAPEIPRVGSASTHYLRAPEENGIGQLHQCTVEHVLGRIGFTVWRIDSGKMRADYLAHWGSYQKSTIAWLLCGRALIGHDITRMIGKLVFAGRYDKWLYG